MHLYFTPTKKVNSFISNWIMILLLTISNLISANAQVTITNIDDLKQTVNNAIPGDVIIIKDGSYDANGMTLNVKGTKASPITIKAESIGGVTFENDTKFILRTCEYLIVEGIVFTNNGTAIKLEGSNNIRITRNTFRLNEDGSTKWVFIGGVWDEPNSSLSHHNRIDHNLFENKKEAGHYITIDGSGGVTQSQFDLIDHNYFRNNTPRFKNEKESIRVGWSEMSKSSGFTIIEFNFFEQCNGDPEIISIKSNDNIVRHNTFTKSEGTVSLRHGNRNRVEGNYFFGGGTSCSTDDLGTHCSGGVRIYGEDHVIINNYFEGLKGERWDAPITLTQGDAESGNGSLSKHFRIERAVIAYNTLINNDFGIEIGYDNNGKYSKPPRDVVIAYNIVQANQNNLIRYYNQPSNMTWKNNVMHTTGSAKLTSDGSTFSNNEIILEDPKLEFDDITKTWKATDATRKFETDNSLAGKIEFDIHGDSRGTNSTIGADDFNTASVRFVPLAANDVGPTSYHPDYDGETEVDFLLASPTNLEFPATEASQPIDVTSNIDWTVSATDDWIILDKTNGSESETITVTISENNDFSIRKGIISIVGGNITREIQIFQEAAEVDLGGEKLIISKITATSEQIDGGNTNGKENTIDGDLSTRWSAEGEQSITFELADRYEVSYFKIAFHKGDSRTTTIQIDVSVDNSTFSTVSAKAPSSGTTADLEIYDIEDVTAKYVKITGYGNSDSDWNSITEVEIWGNADPVEILNIGEGLDHALNLYPMPAKNVLFIKNLDSNYNQYKLYTLLGKEISSGTIMDSQIQLNKIGFNKVLIVEFSGTNVKSISRNIKIE